MSQLLLLLLITAWSYEAKASVCFGFKEHLSPDHSVEGIWFLQFASPMKDNELFRELSPACGVYKLYRLYDGQYTDIILYESCAEAYYGLKDTEESSCDCIGINYLKGSKKEINTGTSFGFLMSDRYLFLRNFTTCKQVLHGRKVRQTSATAFRRVPVPSTFKETEYPLPRLKPIGDDSQIRYYDLVATDNNKSYRVLVSCDDGRPPSKNGTIEIINTGSVPKINFCSSLLSPKVWIFSRCQHPAKHVLSPAFEYLKKHKVEKKDLIRFSHPKKCVYPKFVTCNSS